MGKVQLDFFHKESFPCCYWYVFVLEYVPEELVFSDRKLEFLEIFHQREYVVRLKKGDTFFVISELPQALLLN